MAKVEPMLYKQMGLKPGERTSVGALMRRKGKGAMKEKGC